MEDMDDVTAVGSPTMLFTEERPNTPELMEEKDKPQAEQAEASPVPDTELSTCAVVQQETTPSTTHLYLDDVDRMLCHEDFPSLLALTVRVKQAREAIAGIHGSFEPKRTASEMDPNQVINAVTRMQQQHVLRYKDAEVPVIRRGTYHMTDSLLNENFHILQQEMERCNNWIAAAKEQEKKNAAVPVSTKKSKSEKEAIAVKYAKWQTDILMEWMLEHIEHPFPDAQQMKELCQVTGLTHAQVVNWTTNMRKRSLKATVENGKKPHHFLDFAFLAQDREKQHNQRKMKLHEQQPQKTSVTRKNLSPGKQKKKVPFSRLVQQPGRPYATVIHHGYQHGPPPPSPFRPHLSNAYYPMHPQTMVHPQGGLYTHFPTIGQQEQHALPYSYPNPVYSYVHHQPSHTSHQSMAQQYEGREDNEHMDEWDIKVRAVSESFDGSAFEEEGDPLLTFANYWGGDAQGDTRDDVQHDNDDIMEEPELTLDSLDMDAFIAGIESEQMAMHDHQGDENQILQDGQSNYLNGLSSDTGIQVAKREGQYHTFEEKSGADDSTAFRLQRRTSSFSVDMEEFEEDMGANGDLDMADLFVNV